jgi:hypothetical protein
MLDDVQMPKPRTVTHQADYQPLTDLKLEQFVVRSKP